MSSYILAILSGLVLGFYEFFQERKDKTFSEMNILLYENEIPENKQSEDEPQQNWISFI